MKMTFVLPGYSWKPGGGTRIIYELANRLVMTGHEVNIIHPRQIVGASRPSGPYAFVKEKIRLLRDILFRPSLAWASIDDRVNILYVPEPSSKHIPEADFIFVTYWLLVDYLPKYPASRGLPGYIFQHYETWAGPKDLVDLTWQLPYLKIVVSKWLMEIGRSLGASNLFYVPDAVDRELFRLTRPIKDRTPCVSMLFSTMPWKGSLDGLAAINLAKECFPGLSAVIFGVGERPADLPAWIEYWQNPGQNDLVDKIYNRSSIHLCPSLVEGFALPPAEAMACGNAVVSTDCFGNREYAEPEETALLSPASQPQLLANNIMRLLRNDELRIKLAETGYERIKEFNWDRTLGLFLEALKEYQRNKQDQKI
jgi:glycosyltransferase involved in cell wall biosynthesis